MNLSFNLRLKWKKDVKIDKTQKLWYTYSFEFKYYKHWASSLYIYNTINSAFAGSLWYNCVLVNVLKIATLFPIN